MLLRNVLCWLVYNFDLGPFGPWVLDFAFKGPRFWRPVTGLAQCEDVVIIFPSFRQSPGGLAFRSMNFQ
jgi:hypothetical protein